MPGEKMDGGSATDRKRSKPEKIAQEILATGGEVAAKADVSAPGEVGALFDKAEETFGGVDIVVNNAGIMQPGLPSQIPTTRCSIASLQST